MVVSHVRQHSADRSDILRAACQTCIHWSGNACGARALSAYSELCSRQEQLSQILFSTLTRELSQENRWTKVKYSYFHAFGPEDLWAIASTFMLCPKSERLPQSNPLEKRRCHETKIQQRDPFYARQLRSKLMFDGFDRMYLLSLSLPHAYPPLFREQ